MEIDMCKKQIKIAPSILAADAANLGEELRRIEEAGADWVHVDVMDGHFVPNLAYSPDIVKALRKVSGLVFDVHLMISEPMKYIKAFADAGADIITIHHEATENPEKEIDYIHSLGKRAGISVKPGTDVSVVLPYIKKLDLLLIMTVEPGFGGQSYMQEMNEKILKARKMIDEYGLATELQVDGGVTAENIFMPSENGATVMVAGSAIFKASDIPSVIKKMRAAAQ
jgi:ribulose-phosphate 3-epimerase